MGQSVSSSSVSKVADYLLWLWETMKLSVSSIKTHRSMLSTVLRFKLPELGDHHVLRHLIQSFAGECPHRPPMPPSWDLDIVLKHLFSLAYKPLESVDLHILSKKTLFLLALATAKRVGVLQALSKRALRISGGMGLMVRPSSLFRIGHLLVRCRRVRFLSSCGR